MTAADDPALASPAAPAAPTRNNKALVLCSLALLTFYAWFVVLAGARGFSLFGPGPGSKYDFECFWGAGRLALAGRAAAAYRWPELRDVLAAAIGAQFGTHALPWVYPPLFFIAVTPIARLPYTAAAAVWVAGTLASYLAAARAILPSGTALLVALAAPPVLITLSTGQNGLLTAALFGGALALLDRRPIPAGVLIGALAYKPQFGVLLPFMLALTGRWLVFAVAALTVAALTLFAGTVFGWDTFAGFAQSIGVAQDVYLQQQGNALGVLQWDHLESIYGMLRAFGIGPAIAWPAHLAAAFAAGAACLWIAAGRATAPLKAACLVTAAFIVSPYSEINDLAILTVAMAFIVSDGIAGGFRRWEKAALTVVFIMPLLFLFTPAFLAAGTAASPTGLVGLGPLMCAILAAIIVARALRRPR